MKRLHPFPPLALTLTFHTHPATTTTPPPPPPPSDKFFSREAIDELILRAQARNAYYYGEMDDWLWEAIDRYPVAGL
jgi:hypothetical protein